LFAEFPTDLMETKSAVKLFRYSGVLETVSEEGPNLLETPKIINGPIIKCIKDAHKEVLSLLKSGIKVESGFVNKYIIPERAIKEAITNAVIHRDYYVKRDIEIKIFEDRIEVDSPGLLPYNMTTSNIGRVRADGYRNDLIVKNLREFPEPPNLDANEGVVTMRAQMKKHNLYEPIFLTYPTFKDFVKVVLFNEIVATEWDKVEDFLKNNKYINNEKAREITGVKQRDRMTQFLRKWVNQGLLIQIIPKSGFVKGTKYKLSTSETSL
jgi:ATP-dependent DNA helicase RecG